MSQIPRRNRLDQNTPTELLIREAILAVEVMPADTRLTDAVILLGQARDRVADFIDNVTGPEAAQASQAQSVTDAACCSRSSEATTDANATDRSSLLSSTALRACADALAPAPG